MMHGAFFFPCSKRSRTRLAPTPTNISTKSEPESEKNGTFASPATAFARSVLPVPGGPISKAPLGILPPRSVYFFRVFKEIHDFHDLHLCLFQTSYILKCNIY